MVFQVTVEFEMTKNGAQNPHPTLSDAVRFVEEAIASRVEHVAEFAESPIKIEMVPPPRVIAAEVPQVES